MIVWSNGERFTRQRAGFLRLLSTERGVREELFFVNSNDKKTTFDSILREKKKEKKHRKYERFGDDDLSRLRRWDGLFDSSSIGSYKKVEEGTPDTTLSSHTVLVCVGPTAPLD